ncbi:MAG TPA: flagellar biosynthesis protein FliP [Synergistetes bacterium]|nr:flagellar biosynthesis protein FliP [Synergistota bacterium]
MRRVFFSGFVCLVLLAVLLHAVPAFSQTSSFPALPVISINGGDGSDPGQVSMTLQILLLITVLSLAPAIALMATCFTRILVVLGFLRNAMGIQQLPPNQVIVTLALFLTLFIMRPVWERVYDDAYMPFQEGAIGTGQAIDKAMVPVRGFMLKHTRDEELSLMVSLSGSERPQDQSEISLLVLLPAFMLSELKTAFQMGVVIFLPFLVVDMIVSSILMAMGMIMLPPMLVSLPFKVLLFVLADGWDLVVMSLIRSFD